MTIVARAEMPPVTLKWFDGGLLPPRPADLEEGRMMGERGGGVIFYGTKGKLMCSVYGENPRLIPETFMKEYGKPKKRLARSPGIHEEWVNCIKENKQATSNFDYAGKLTETMLLGIIAMRGSGRQMKQAIPFGPFLSAGAIGYLFYGPEVIRWYLSGMGG